VPQLRLDQRLFLRGSRPIFLYAVAPVLAAAVAVAAAGPGRAPSHEALVEAARRIQNVCFATYPPDLVRRLTGRDDVPAEFARYDLLFQFESGTFDATALFEPQDGAPP